MIVDAELKSKGYNLRKRVNIKSNKNNQIFDKYKNELGTTKKDNQESGKKSEQ